MPRGDKSKYSAKQKRQAEDIEKGYEAKGTPKKEAQKRAWATVNKMWGKGVKGTAEKKPNNTKPAQKGGKLGGKSAASRSAAARSASAKKAAATRKANAQSASSSRSSTKRSATAARRAKAR